MDESQNKVQGRKIDLNVPAKVQRPWMTKETMDKAVAVRKAGK